MPPKNEPVPRARSALQWLGGLLVLGILGGLLVTAAAALWQNVDINSLARQAAAVDNRPPPLPDEGDGPMAVADRPVEAALYVNEATRGYFEDSTYMPGLLAEWRRTLGALGWSVRTIGTRAELEALPPSTLVVAPDALCLSNGEIESLFRHLRRGGGAVANWALGARDGRCQWRGWDTLRDFTGALDVVEYQAGDELFLTVPAGLPVSAGLPPGARIEFYADSHLGLLGKGPHVYWSDWALNSISTGGEAAADAAMSLYRTAGGGRALWLGFRPRQAIRDLDKARVTRLTNAGLRWAAGLPSAAVAPWPEGRRAGLLIAEDSENGITNAASLARMLREADMPGTFYAVSDMALEHPDLADSLLAAGEVGSHTADHVPTVGLPLSEQEIRLDRSVRELEDWTGGEILGFRPPEERFDDATLRAWLRAADMDAGTPYVAAVNGARSAAPEIYRYDEGPIVMLPRLMKDDYNVLVQEGTRRPERILADYLEGMRKLGALGGFALVGLHTQIAGSPGQIGVVGTVIDSIAAQRDTWWVATGRDVARWWLDRDAMRVRLTDAPPPADSAGVAADSAGTAAELQLQLDAPRGTGAREVWVDVVLPGGERLPYEDDRQLPYARTPWGIRIPVRALTPGETRTIRLVPTGAAPKEADAAD
ncbi:MAG: polysaccharide deacetylase family protein [Gemmatimonadales bacterium]|jgi:peptidoglycan/xylan/chitin deacetylase (PgdA/CDA1 family)